MFKAPLNSSQIQTQMIAQPHFVVGEEARSVDRVMDWQSEDMGSIARSATDLLCDQGTVLYSSGAPILVGTSRHQILLITISSCNVSKLVLILSLLTWPITQSQGTDCLKAKSSTVP